MSILCGISIFLVHHHFASTAQQFISARSKLRGVESLQLLVQ